MGSTFLFVAPCLLLAGSGLTPPSAFFGVAIIGMATVGFLYVGHFLNPRPETLAHLLIDARCVTVAHPVTPGKELERAEASVEELAVGETFSLGPITVLSESGESIPGLGIIKRTNKHEFVLNVLAA